MSYSEAFKLANRSQGVLTFEESTGHYWSRSYGVPLAIGERIVRRF